MSWHTNPGVVALRNLLRRLGLNRLLHSVLFRGKGYEAGFDSRLAEAIANGECVWDVGANKGYYTLRFASVVGPTGHVVAFEPSPQNFAVLSQAVAGHANVSARQEALGATMGQLGMLQGKDELGATSRLITECGETASFTVPVTTGDRLIETEGLSPPSVVKIDVEGFELEVIGGMARLLNSGNLRALGVEIHFGILARRGMADAPRQIEAQLLEAGFAVDWVDVSHILARRQA